MAAGGGDGGKLGVKKEVRWDGGRGGGGDSGIGLEAREVVDGGAYGMKLAEKVIRDRWVVRIWWWSRDHGG